MYIAELPQDVQTIIRYALVQRHIEDFGDEYLTNESARKFLFESVQTGMDSKLSDIMYLFENVEC